MLRRLVAPLLLLAALVPLAPPATTPAAAAPAPAGLLKPLGPLPPLLPIPTPVTASPAEAEPGQQITVTGSLLLGVTARLGGRPLTVIGEAVDRVVLQLPDDAPFGPTTLTVSALLLAPTTRPITIVDGVLLGPGGTTSKLPRGSRPEVIDAATGVIRTRIDAVLDPSRTPAQVNAALNSVGGRIAAMAPGMPAVAVAVPAQPTVAALQQLADRLVASGAFLTASVGRQASIDELPPRDDDSTTVAHLMAERFPEAWNARSAMAGCTPINIVVPDVYDRPSTLRTEVLADVKAPSVTETGTGSYGNHGWKVLSTLAAGLDASALSGALPSSRCARFVLLQAGGFSRLELVHAIGGGLPSGPTVLSISLGYWYTHGTVAEALAGSRPAELAVLAITFAGLIKGRANDLVYASSAGNSADSAAAAAYPGLGISAFNSAWSLATHGFDPDTLDSAFLWGPDLLATAAEHDAVDAAAAAAGLTLPLAPAANGHSVGSVVGATGPLTDFSNTGPTITATGQDIPFGEDLISGTSFSAPQVAGLAAYLWAMKPSLRAPAIRSLLLETANDALMIGAYDAVLGLDDGPLTPAGARVRLALVDVNGDGRFTEADLPTLVDATTTDGPVAASLRGDLNGDTFFGSIDGPAPFDLDADGVLAPGTYDVDGVSVSFDEHRLGDREAFCRYAYSPLYTGNVDRRSEELAGLCAPTQVEVQRVPGVEVAGQPIRFTATETGTRNRSFEWSATAGTISADGRLVVQQPGPVTVFALSNLTGAVGSATVDVRPGVGTIVLGTTDITGSSRAAARGASTATQSRGVGTSSASVTGSHDTARASGSTTAQTLDVRAVRVELLDRVNGSASHTVGGDLSVDRQVQGRDFAVVDRTFTVNGGEIGYCLTTDILLEGSGGLRTVEVTITRLGGGGVGEVVGRRFTGVVNECGALDAGTYRYVVRGEAVNGAVVQGGEIVQGTSDQARSSAYRVEARLVLG